MAMFSANPPASEIRALIHMHGAAKVARAFFGALLHRRTPRPLIPDTLRADVGLPPVAREMRRYWEHL